MLVAWAACPLLAAKFPGLGASALAWACAGYLATGRACSWPGFRALLEQNGFRNRRLLPAGLPRSGQFGTLDISATHFGSRYFLLALGIAPVGASSLIPASAVLAGQPIAGPAAGSVFRRMGPGLSYGFPLFVAAGYLAAQGRCRPRRSAGYAFAAMLTTDLAANVIYLAWHVSGGQPLDPIQLVRLMHINAAVTARMALLWLAAVNIDAWRRDKTPARPRLLVWSVAASLAAVRCSRRWRCQLLWNPAGAWRDGRRGGAKWGWTALLLWTPRRPVG